MHPNHASSDLFGALLFAHYEHVATLCGAHFDRSVVEGATASVQKDPGSLGYARDDTREGRHDTKNGARGLNFFCVSPA